MTDTVTPVPTATPAIAYPTNDKQITVILAIGAFCAKLFAIYLFITQHGSMAFTFSVVVAVLVSVPAALQIMNFRIRLKEYSDALNAADANRG